jgi:hypothetical protein
MEVYYHISHFSEMPYWAKWWHASIVPATQEAETERSLEHKSLRPAWATQQDIVSKKINKIIIIKKTAKSLFYVQPPL